MKYRTILSLLVGLILLLMAVWLMTSCSMEEPYPDSSPSTGGQTPPEGNNSQDETEETHPAYPEQRIDNMIKGMTLEEKVGQMLFLAYRWNTAEENALHMDAVLEDTINRYHPGGFVLFSENLDSIDQTVSFISGLQGVSEIPLLISIDEEGGLISRLNTAPKLHATQMPEAYTIGLTGKPEYAYRSAKAIAEELSGLGFNMDFAPVADIFSNPENSVIGRRSYGTEPGLVSEMVKEAVKGYLDGQVIPVLKHFPGHGDTVADTHYGAASVDHDLDRLINHELVPFREGIEAGADVVMLAHILLPNLMEEPIPASLSKEVVTGLLRESLGFEGVVITDALEMSAVSSFYDDGDAAVKAVQAGIDMLLMPQSAETAQHAILMAVENGLIPEERINESVFRILQLKEKYGILDNNIKRPDPEQTLGSSEHRALADEINNRQGDGDLSDGSGK